MRHILHKLIFCFTAIVTLATAHSFGQKTEVDFVVKTKYDKVEIGFRRGMSIVDIGYPGNERTLQKLKSALYSGQKIDSIIITAYSSPDGTSWKNEGLTKKRAVNCKGYLLWRYPWLNSNIVHTRIETKRWTDLRILVEEDHYVPYKKEVLAILDSNLNDEDLTEARLREIGSGVAYEYISQHYLNKLRIAVFKITYPLEKTNIAFTESEGGNSVGSGDTGAIKSRKVGIEELEEKVELKQTLTEINSPRNAAEENGVRSQKTIQTEENKETLSVDSLKIVIPKFDTANLTDAGIAEIPDKLLHLSNYSKRPLMAIKTNLLYDLATVLNVEAEVPIGKHWSINGEYQFPWWADEKNNSYAIQLMSGGLEGRYWLGRRSDRRVLTGHFLGLFAGAGLYDFQLNKKYGYQGEFYITSGISYGYAIPLRSPNLSMEFSLGFGFVKTNYRHYNVVENGSILAYQYDGTWQWFGPTKAKISISWLINRKNKKGGER